MTTADPRDAQYAGLTDPERVLARADAHMSYCDEPALTDCVECSRKLAKYRKYLAALADAGLLIPPGGETREEWGYQVAGHADPWGHTRFRHRAEERLSAFLGQVPSGDAHLVRRTVHVGPWQPAEASEGDTNG